MLSYQCVTTTFANLCESLNFLSFLRRRRVCWKVNNFLKTKSANTQTRFYCCNQNWRLLPFFFFHQYVVCCIELVRSLARPFNYFNYQFIHSFIHSFIQSFSHLFIRSFIHTILSFVQVFEEQREEICKVFPDISLEKLPEKLSELKDEVTSQSSSNHSLNLLQGVLWGLLYQFHCLLHQKKVLLSLLNSQHSLRDGVLQIVNTLEDQLSGCRNNSSEQQSQYRGVFRFRKLVIAVLAYNRLLRFRNNKQCFVLNQRPSFGHNGLIFFASSTDHSDLKSKLKWKTLKCLIKRQRKYR